eukprot:77610-Amphidinium_carterae.1
MISAKMTLSSSISVSGRMRPREAVKWLAHVSHCMRPDAAAGLDAWPPSALACVTDHEDIPWSFVQYHHGSLSVATFCLYIRTQLIPKKIGVIGCQDLRVATHQCAIASQSQCSSARRATETPVSSGILEVTLRTECSELLCSDDHERIHTHMANLDAQKCSYRLDMQITLESSLAIGMSKRTLHTLGNFGR